MMKKLFTDGLIQIAIILSLMRSDLHEYLNVHSFGARDRYIEHEIILGSGTSAFTRTEYYQESFGEFSTSIHPKNVNNYISNPIFRDLYNLRENHHINNIDIQAYLVGESASDGNRESENNVNSDTELNSVSTENNTTNQSLEESDDVPVGSELTKEDMDLIEILWRQDIDMGVSKDTFSSNIQKELVKNEEKQEPKEELKDEAQSTPSNSDTPVTFVIDVETGELVQVANSNDMPETNQPSMEVEYHSTNESSMPITFEDAIEILEQESQGVSNISTLVPDQQDPYVMDAVSEQEIDNLVQNISQLSGLSYSRQTSIEARWNDVEGLINRQDSNFTNLSHDNNMALNSTLHTSLQDTVLLNNASLGNVLSQDTSFNLTNIGTANDVLPVNLNDSETLFNSNENLLSTLFPNASNLAVENVNASGSDMNLQDLLTNVLPENRTDFNITSMQMNLTDVVTDAVKVEDRDSAVGSMGSETDDLNNLQDFVDSSSDVSSPFDGLEGATGGNDTSSMTKTNLNSERFSFSTFDKDRYSANNTMGENDTSYFDDEDFAFADDGAVAHNHSYPLKPGQLPKEDKRLRDIDQRISRSKDERRAKAMKLPFSIDDIIHTPVEKFTELLNQHKLSDQQLQLVKDIRRRGKNKVAAQNCRKRKMEVIESLEDSVHRMRQERDTMARERNSLEKQKNQMRDMYSGLYRDVFRSLRDEHGRPYDPNEYTLQHTGDGNVFLIPKSNSSNDEPQIKGNKKKKNNK